MGQKINPIGYRLSVRRDWQSRWFARGREFADMVLQDANARAYIKRRYAQAAVSRVEIERPAKSARVIIHTARPGMVIGKKGEDVERLRAILRRILGVATSVDIREIRQPEREAQLIAANIASQLERRVMFRRAMKRAMANAMRLGVEGIKIMSAGRLNGMEIARSQWYREGRVPLHTLRADIAYGFAEAKTSMGVVGVKVWISNGEKFTRVKKVKHSAADALAERSPTEENEEAAESAPAEAAIDEPATAEAAEETKAAPPTDEEADEEKAAEAEAAPPPAEKKAAKKAAKKPAAKKAAAAKKPAAKKPAAKKAAAPKPKKAAVKKAAAKKPAVKKAAKKKGAAKKAVKGNDAAAGEN